MGVLGRAVFDDDEAQAERCPAACPPPPLHCTACHGVAQAFLIEIALGWVGHKAGGQLNTQYKLPKMR